MQTRLLPLLASIAVAAGVVGCAAPQPRADYYRDRGYDSRYDDRGYEDRRYSSNCRQCGSVSDVERVYVDRGGGTSGGGAVLGAIIGGVLGNTVGRGDGRKAATVAGAVAGGFAGNAVERNNNREGGDGWRIHVDLDDGRSAVVTQYRNPGLRRGDRVVIRNQQVELMR